VNLLVGLSAVLLCTVLQGLMLAALVGAFRHAHGRGWIRRAFVPQAVILCLSVTALMAGIGVQVGIWAVVFVWIGEIDAWQTAVYFSLVNFTTLGYGDIILSDAHAILGPMEAANGVLMLGLCTSFLFAAVNLLMGRDRPDRSD
jgi:hypothetical protein